MYTIDASVWTADENTSEPGHADSRTFLNAVRQQKAQVFCPTLCLIEVAAALFRPTSNLAATQRGVRTIQKYPNLRLVSLTQERAKNGLTVATQARLRGADAVYVALAQEFGTTLITWDQEMINRAGFLVSVVTPTDWLAQQAAQVPPTTPPTP